MSSTKRTWWHSMGSSLLSRSLRGPSKESEDEAAPRYQYLKLSDVVHQQGLVDFYASVSSVEEPKRAKNGHGGGDWVCTLTVQDMSYQREGLRCVLWAPDISLLPRVRALHDIVRFHRAKVSEYLGRPQVSGRVSVSAGPGGQLQFLLFDGQPGGGHEPYQASSRSFTTEAQDRTLLESLREWQPEGAQHYEAPFLKDIKVDASTLQYPDITCKVLSVVEPDPEHNKVVFLWDGSDVPPQNVDLVRLGKDLAVGHGTEYPFPAPPRAALPHFPVLGSALPLLVEAEAEGGAQTPGEGEWARFRNIEMFVHQGLVQARMGKFSRVLPAERERVARKEEAYSERLEQENAVLHQHALHMLVSATITDHENVPFSSLRQALAHPEVPFKFRCIVRILHTWPSRVEDFCVRAPAAWAEGEGAAAVGGMGGGAEVGVGAGAAGDENRDTGPQSEGGWGEWFHADGFQSLEGAGDGVRGPGHEGRGAAGGVGGSGADGGGQDTGNGGQYVFRVRLFLEDPTARMFAYLGGEDAVKFFNGQRAADMRSPHSSSTVAVLRRKLAGLRGHAEGLFEGRGGGGSGAQ